MLIICMLTLSRRGCLAKPLKTGPFDAEPGRPKTKPLMAEQPHAIGLSPWIVTRLPERVCGQ